MGRARVATLRGKMLVSLPIKERDNTVLDHDILNDALESLLDVARELELTTFSIARTHMLDGVPWPLIQERLVDLFRDIPCQITICKGTVRTPPVAEREAFIQECHSSAVGGHKGITKTYNRMRQRYYWSNMKSQIQAFIQRCENCQLKKLVRVKHRQPMLLTDTPGTAFDKVALDIMRPLPTTKRGTHYILTIQDQLTKFLVLTPLINATSVDIAEAFRKWYLSYLGHLEQY